MSEEASDEDNDTSMPYNMIGSAEALYIAMMQLCRGFGFLRERIVRHNLRL